MQLATDIQNFAVESLGLVEAASSYLNDRQRKQWSKPELVAHVNDAQWTLAMAINRVHKEFFVTSSTTDLVAGQAYYTLPEDLAMLIGIDVVNDATTDREPVEMTPVLLSDRRFYEGLALATKKDDYRFYVITGTDLGLFPEGGSVNGEKMRAHYVKRLTRLVANEEVSVIPEQYHQIIAMDAARLAMIKTKQTNAQLERMRAEAFDSMLQEVRIFTTTREERVEPFYGSFGPYPGPGFGIL